MAKKQPQQERIVRKTATGEYESVRVDVKETKPMFECRNGGLTVYEAFNGFYISYRPRRDKYTQGAAYEPVVCGMGDGVDMFCDRDGNPIPVGTKAFYTAMRKLVREDKRELLEAYFGIEG